MEYKVITVNDSIGPVGAEISGVDLSQPLSAGIKDELHAAWLRHRVLFFRQQDLAPKQLARFAANFGELDIYPFIDAVNSHPNVIPIIKEPDAQLNFGGAWHVDTTYLERPPKATILYGVEVPNQGGDTLFADATSAYQTLSNGIRSMLESNSGIYTAKIVHGSHGSYTEPASRDSLGSAYTGDAEKAELEVDHPLIRTHSETGNKSIYCSLPHTHRIKGWTREESLPLFKFLTKLIVQEQFVTRFKWQKGSVAMWDNRCVFHNAMNDYHGEKRHMLRVIVKGDRPV